MRHMYTKSTIAGVFLGVVAFAVTPVLAQTSPITTDGSSTVTTKIQCVGAAVGAREQSLGTAMTAFTNATNTAYTARATALATAYTQTTNASVKSSVNSAWSTFTSSMKTARQAWQSARTSAWNQYRTSANLCRASAGVGDGAKSKLDVSGN